MVRWTISKDLLLLRDMAVNFPKTALDWQLIAIDNKLYSSPEFQVTGRGVRERWLKTILMRFKSQQTEALKKSGTEEEYVEFDQLLQDLVERQNDLDTENENASKSDARKREEGLQLREKAMVTLKNKHEMASTSSSPVTPGDDGTPLLKKRHTHTPTPSTSQQAELFTIYERMR